MNLEDRVTALETRIECLSMLVVALTGIQNGLNPDLLEDAVSQTANLHAANALYEIRLSDDQIQKVEAMLKLYLQR